MIQVTGTVIDPMGQSSVGTEVRIETVSSPVTLKGAVASITTGAGGSYDFNLVEGIHLIEVKYAAEEYITTGHVEVTAGMSTALPLSTLLTYHAVTL